MKTCNRCREAKPPEAFHVLRSARDGRQSMCKVCRSEHDRARWRDDREAEQERARRWLAEHPEWNREKSRRWRAEHPEESASHLAALHASADPEQVRATIARWNRAHPEKRREYGRRYTRKNPDKVAEKNARRKAARLGVHAEPVDRQAVFDRDGGICHICRKPVDRATFTLDHLDPIALGGEHSPRNVAVAHPSCNYSRGAGRIPAQMRLIG